MQYESLRRKKILYASSQSNRNQGFNIYSPMVKNLLIAVSSIQPLVGGPIFGNALSALYELEKRKMGLY